MTTTHSVPDNAVLVAIDIAKARNDVLIEIPGHKRRRRLVVQNTRAEHDRFVELLRSFNCPLGALGLGRPLAMRLRPRLRGSCSRASCQRRCARPKLISCPSRRRKIAIRR